MININRLTVYEWIKKQDSTIRDAVNGTGLPGGTVSYQIRALKDKGHLVALGKELGDGNTATKYKLTSKIYQANESTRSSKIKRVEDDRFLIFRPQKESASWLGVWL